MQRSASETLSTALLVLAGLLMSSTSSSWSSLGSSLVGAIPAGRLPTPLSLSRPLLDPADRWGDVSLTRAAWLREICGGLDRADGADSDPAIDQAAAARALLRAPGFQRRCYSCV